MTGIGNLCDRLDSTRKAVQTSTEAEKPELISDRWNPVTRHWDVVRQWADGRVEVTPR